MGNTDHCPFYATGPLTVYSNLAQLLRMGNKRREGEVLELECRVVRERRY